MTRGAGMGVGIAVGISIGVAMHNVAIGVAIGVALGAGSAFEDCARRNGGDRVRGGRRRRIRLSDAVQSVDQVSQFEVAAGLQISIGEIIHCVKLLVPRTGHAGGALVGNCSCLRCDVRFNQFVPQAKPSEDVRRHVLRMREKSGATRA